MTQPDDLYQRLEEAGRHLREQFERLQALRTEAEHPKEYRKRKPKRRRRHS